jgi:omega-6 fatty acid desaturase (delta-12 desaturase)
MSVLFTNLLIIVVVLFADRFIGWRTYLQIQLPVLCFAGAAGIWLFYVQHQFPGGYWARKSDWDLLRVALEGCSFYKLPAVLWWFSSNIGNHHVHHLGPRIPNYCLKKCFDAVPTLLAKVPLTFVKSLSCIRLKVWDEERQRMVAFAFIEIDGFMLMDAGFKARCKYRFFNQPMFQFLYFHLNVNSNSIARAVE